MSSYICVKVFKNGPSKICARQCLKILKWYGLLRQKVCNKVSIKLHLFALGIKLSKLVLIPINWGDKLMVLMADFNV